ncbi:MAG: hypothetical protein Q8L20_12505 [Gammaproteobacteria bacterium]|nr:hypothetical protein [Gammaproteobacteria bacterium]
MPEITLTGHPNDIGWILSIMLFPNDEALRNQNYGINVAKLELSKADERSEKWLSPQSESLEPSLSTRKITTLLIDAPSDADFKKIRTERMKRGCIAGQVLTSLYLMDRFKWEEPSLHKAIYVTEKFGKKTKYSDGSKLPAESKIKEYWKEYKSVAHFWAALELNGSYTFVSDKYDCFSDKGFTQFLQVAAGIYDFGIEFIPKRARPRKPILDAEECWVLDSSIRPVELQSDIKPDNLINILKKYKAPKTVI